MRTGSPIISAFGQVPHIHNETNSPPDYSDISLEAATTQFPSPSFNAQSNNGINL
jgi:hypothetical protein